MKWVHSMSFYKWTPTLGRMRLGSTRRIWSVYYVHNMINKIVKSNFLWENRIFPTRTAPEPKQDNFKNHIFFVGSIQFTHQTFLRVQDLTQSLSFHIIVELYERSPSVCYFCKSSFSLMLLLFWFPINFLFRSLRKNVVIIISRSFRMAYLLLGNF